METKASSATIRVSPEKAYPVSLKGAQIAMLLNILREAHFKGSEVALAASVIDAIQEPILADAHGVAPKQET